MAIKMARFALGISAMGAIFIGCPFLPSEEVSKIDWITSVLTLTPLPTPLAQVSSSPSPPPIPIGLDRGSLLAKQARANAETLREMLEVIFIQEPKDRSEFGNWADTLNQGASLEGVYNGLTHSADYRKFEEANLGASVEALQVFTSELALLELELPEATQFDSVSDAPLPGGGQVQASKPTLDTLVGQYSKQFVGASVFTLKRVICDEALKVIATKSQYREKLANWFARWAVHMGQRHVDFGIALRNNSDEGFHFRWALQGTDDRIKWEVLNRLHRVLNGANRQKQ